MSETRKKFQGFVVRYRTKTGIKGPDTYLEVKNVMMNLARYDADLRGATKGTKMEMEAWADIFPNPPDPEAQMQADVVPIWEESQLTLTPPRDDPHYGLAPAIRQVAGELAICGAQGAPGVPGAMGCISQTGPQGKAS